MVRIPEEINMYLSEISRHLAQGRAVAMIGAGFSKNAVKVGATDKKFLNWNELGDVFYKNIYGKLPEESSGHYLDALKLASIIETASGRPSLDKLLLDSLPDEEYAPGELHKKLLNLNWADIFTTNYDTLLERTRKFIPNRKYQAVLQMEDLVYSVCPRIVKLHGSFPSCRPFIISQEDYRRYPRDFAAFVNTVQQALIENVLCLIGFSGDDPNFLNWIGWIRDNLGNNHNSKIYLITTDTQRRVEGCLLSARNIVILNLAECFSGGKVSHREALSFFFDELQKRQDTGKQGDWLEAGKNMSVGNVQNQELREETLFRLYEFWSHSKHNYPGWIVMPHKARRCLEKSLRDAGEWGVWDMVKETEHIPSLEEYVLLYDWVRQACFLPLTEEMSHVYEEVVKASEDSSRTWDLMISLLTFYRQRGEPDNFCRVKGQLAAAQGLTEEQKNLLRCEKALFSLYRCEYEELDSHLSTWPMFHENFSYELIHAGLMWEAEKYRQSLSLLVSMLDGIRSAGSTGTNLKILSQEAYTLNLIKKAVPQAEFLTLDKELRGFAEEDYYRKGNREELLKADRCDPENEIELFRAALANLEVSGNLEDSYDISARFVNFLERTGNFMVISSRNEYAKELKTAISHIIQKNFYWGMLLSVRTREDQFIRKMARMGVLHGKKEEIDTVARHLCRICCQHLYTVAGSMRTDTVSHRHLVWGDYLPIILGAMIYRCGADTREEIFRLAGEMGRLPGEFQELDYLVRNVLRSLDRDFILEHAEEVWELGLSIDGRKNPRELYALDLCDWMLYDMAPLREKISEEVIRGMEYRSAKETGGLSKAARLCVDSLLYEIDALSEQQRQQFRMEVEQSIGEEDLSLDFYYYIRDMAAESPEMKEKVKEKLLRKVYALSCCVDPENGECAFQFQVFRKLRLLQESYGFVWTAKEAGLLLKSLVEWKKLEDRLEKAQYAYLLGNFYLLFLKTLWPYKDVVSQVEEKAQDKSYGALAGKLLWTQISDSPEYLLNRLYGGDTEEFIGAAGILCQYLKEEPERWSLAGEKLQAVLAAVIRGQEVLSPFCIEVLTEILENVKGGQKETGDSQREKAARYEVDFLAIKNVLELLYPMEVKSNFQLVQRICGARLACAASAFAEKNEGLKVSVDKWKDLANQEGEHALVRKQWK